MQEGQDTYFKASSIASKIWHAIRAWPWLFDLPRELMTKTRNVMAMISMS